MEVPVNRQAFELVCDDIFVAPREARWLSLLEKGINEVFERAAKLVPGEGKTKAQATAVRLSKEWSAVLEVHEVPDSLVKEVRGTPMAAKEIDLLSGSQKPRRALHKLQLDAPVTSAPEEVQLSMPIKRLSIVGGAQTLERTEALQQFLLQVRPKELDLHEANPALVRALLKSIATEPKGEHVFKKLDLRGFEVTADDEDLIMRLGCFCRIKFLDLRGRAISGEIAHLLSHFAHVSLGVTTVSEWDAAAIVRYGHRLQALYLDGEWISSALGATCPSLCVASFVDGDLKVTSSFRCPWELAEALPGRLSVLRLGDTLALVPLPTVSEECIPSHGPAHPQHDLIPAPRQLDLAPTPPDLAEDPTTPRLPEFQRKGTIRFLIETMSAIGLKDHLAIGFFSKVYCWLPSHLTVRGLAEDLISAEYDRQKAAGELAGDDLSALLVAIGFEQKVVDSFVARIKDHEFVHHRGLRNVAFDLIDSGIHRWATDYYTPSGEPEDGETKPKGSTGCGRDLGNGGQSGGQGGGRSGDREGGSGGGSGGSSGGGDDSDNEEGRRTRTSAGKEEEKVITLYHGTTFGFAESIFYDGANLSEGRRNTDFAIDRAFYLGNNASRAQRWADQKASQSEDDPVPAYLVFTVNTRMLERYERKVFDGPDDKWKQFVFNNRNPVKRKPVIRKPVATVNVPVITIDFVIGPNWAECAEIVERKYPFRQYAALTPRAIEFLNLCPCKLCKWENGKWIVVDQRPG